MSGGEKTGASAWSIHVIDSATVPQRLFLSHSVLLNTSMFPRPEVQTTLFCLSMEPVLVLTLAEAAGKPIYLGSLVYIHLLNH